MNVDFCLPAFIATKIVTWKFDVDESTTGRYYIILGRYVLTALGLNLKCSGNVIHGVEGPYKGCSAPMVDVNNYDFNTLTTKTVKPEESFINVHVSECFESKIAISETRRMRRILDAKYEKADINKVMTKKCQHQNTKECDQLLTLLRKYEDLFDDTLGTWNTTPVDLELKDDAKPVCSQP